MKNDWRYIARCLTCIHFGSLIRCAAHGYHFQPCGFRDFLCSVQTPASCRLLPPLAQALRQQCRRIGTAEQCPDRRLQVLKHRSPLLGASRDHCPDSFAPAVSPFAPCPLRNQSVDHHEADRLFCQVVGRLYSRSRDELENNSCHASRTSSRHVATCVLSLARQSWHNSENLESGQLQLALELFLSERCSSPMNHPEEAAYASRAIVLHRPDHARRAGSSGTSRRGSSGPQATISRQPIHKLLDRTKVQSQPKTLVENSVPNTLINTFVFRVRVDLEQRVQLGESTQVHMRRRFCLWPVSSTLTRSSSGKRSR